MTKEKKDSLVRIIGEELLVRGLACTTTELCREAAIRHQTSPLASLALARALTGVTLLGALLRSGQTLAVKIEGDGILGKLVVESDSYGRIKGYISHPDAEGESADAQDVATALGQGNITTVRDLNLPELVTGVVPITDGTIDEDLTYYLTHSEQIPSYLAIDVEMSEDGSEILQAGGVLFQVVGDGDPSEIVKLEERMQELPPISALMQSGDSSAEILDKIFANINYELLEEYPVRFQCNCSWERSRKALALLGRKELESVIEEGEATVSCHFCHENYHFTQDDIENIIQEIEEAD